MRKPAFCICENKEADQLRSNCPADQRLCFRYMDGKIPLLPKSKISSHWSSSVAVQPGLCQTRSETPKTGFLTTRLISCRSGFLMIILALDKWQSKMQMLLMNVEQKPIEPRCEKTSFQGFRPGPTKTRLCNRIIWLEA